MALVHEFEKSGNWLFRRRSWLPVILIVAGIFIMYLTNRQAILFNIRKELVFLIISLFGEAIRIYTVGFVPANTSEEIRQQGRLQMSLTQKEFIPL